jgi:hypothetical protein
MPVLLGNYLRLTLLGFMLHGRSYRDYLCCGIAARTAPSCMPDLVARLLFNDRKLFAWVRLKIVGTLEHWNKF